MNRLAEVIKKYRESARIENLKRLPRWLPDSVRIALAEIGYTLWNFENETRPELSEWQQRSEIGKRLCTDKDMEFFWQCLAEEKPHKAPDILTEIRRIESDWRNSDKTLESQKREDWEALQKTLFEVRAILQRERARELRERIEQDYKHFMDRSKSKKLQEFVKFHKQCSMQNSWPRGELRFFDTARHLYEDVDYQAFSEVHISLMPDFFEIIENMEKEIKARLKYQTPRKKRKNDVYAKRRFIIQSLYERIIIPHFKKKDGATKNRLLRCLARAVLDDVEIELKTLSDALEAKR